MNVDQIAQIRLSMTLKALISLNFVIALIFSHHLTQKALCHLARPTNHCPGSCPRLARQNISRTLFIDPIRIVHLPITGLVYLSSAMSIPSFSSTARCCTRWLRSLNPITTASPSSSSRPLHRCKHTTIRFQRLRRHAPSSRRWESTHATAAATADGDTTAISSNPKIISIVDQIGQLTLLETADLVSSLKVCLHPESLSESLICHGSEIPWTVDTLLLSSISIP